MIKLERNLGISELVEINGNLYSVYITWYKGYYYTIQPSDGYHNSRGTRVKLNNSRRTKANTELAYKALEAIIN